MIAILALLFQLTLEQEKALAQPSQPYYCCAVTIRARYADGRYVVKGETRCLSPKWGNYEEQSLDENGAPIEIWVPIGWVTQDSYGGTVWRAHKDKDTCEARDNKGKFGSAVIVWDKPTSVQYIILR